MKVTTGDPALSVTAQLGRATVRDVSSLIRTGLATVDLYIIGDQDSARLISIVRAALRDVPSVGSGDRRVIRYIVHGDLTVIADISFSGDGEPLAHAIAGVLEGPDSAYIARTSAQNRVSDSRSIGSAARPACVPLRTPDPTRFTTDYYQNTTVAEPGPLPVNGAPMVLNDGVTRGFTGKNEGPASLRSPRTTCGA